MVFGVMAFCTAIPSGFGVNVVGEIFLLWFLLFFGGCIVPSATGIIVNSMPKEYQSASSSISQLVFNFGGFFLAPVLSAAVMDQFTDENKALTWGFRFVLSYSLLSLGFGIAGYFAIVKSEGLINAKTYVEQSEEEENIQEIVRRVKPIVFS